MGKTETIFHTGVKFGIFPGKTAAGVVLFFCTSPHGQEQGISGGVSGGVQQHFLSVEIVSGRNREMFLPQWHPSHQQIPSGAAILQNMATVTVQAIHCRNDDNLIVSPIISSIRRAVNNISGEKNRNNLNFINFRGSKFAFSW